MRRASPYWQVRLLIDGKAVADVAGRSQQHARRRAAKLYLSALRNSADAAAGAATECTL